MVSYLGHGITFPVANAGAIKAAGIAFPVVGAVLVLLRALARRISRLSFGMTDLFGLISWFLIVGMGAVFVWSEENGGLGWPTPGDKPQLTKTYITDYQKLILQSEYVFCILMVLALGTTKLSILFFFRHIFLAHRRTFWDYLTRALMGIVVVWTIAFTLAFALECGGYAAAFWKPLAIRVQHCLSINGGVAAYEKACGITDLVLDLFCLGLPFPIVFKIWRLQLSLTRKLSITAIFMVGIMTVAASVARLVIWVEVLNTASNPTEDVNLAVAMSLYWGMIEAGLAFVVSQLPALSPLFTKLAHQNLNDSLRYAADLITLGSLSSRSRNRSRNRSGNDVEHHESLDHENASQSQHEHPSALQSDHAVPGPDTRRDVPGTEKGYFTEVNDTC